MPPAQKQVVKNLNETLEHTLVVLNRVFLAVAVAL